MSRKQCNECQYEPLCFWPLKLIQKEIIKDPCPQGRKRKREKNTRQEMPLVGGDENAT